MLTSGKCHLRNTNVLFPIKIESFKSEPTASLKFLNIFIMIQYILSLKEISPKYTNEYLNKGGKFYFSW